MIKLSRINQLSMFPKSAGNLTKYIIPTLVGDIFETVTQHLTKGCRTSTGINAVRADVIIKKTLIEVKAGCSKNGKVIFSDDQWQYYQQYYDRYKEYGIDIIYMFYTYLKEQPLYMYHDEEEVIKNILEHIDKVYLFNQVSLQSLFNKDGFVSRYTRKRNAIHNIDGEIYHGYTVPYRRLEQLVSKYGAIRRNVPAFKLYGYNVCNFQCIAPCINTVLSDRVILLQNKLCSMGNTQKNEDTGQIEEYMPEYTDIDDQGTDQDMPF